MGRIRGALARRLLPCLTSALLCAAVLPQSAEATHANGYHWKRSPTDPNALTFEGFRYIGVHNGADRSPWLQDIINDATKRWNNTTWQPTVLVPYNLSESSYPWPCDWTPPPSGWGISICYGDQFEGHVLGSTQIMSFYDTAGHRGWVRIMVKPGISIYQMQEAITHELGHALGLGHQPAGGASIMSADGGWSGHPDAHDQDMLAAIYSHPHP